MSVQCTTAAWFGSEAKGGRKLVLLAIADCANDEGWAWPSQATLAAKCGLDAERGIREHVRALVELGELEEYPRPGRTTRYLVRLDVLKNRADERQKPRKDSAGVQNSAGVKDSSHPHPGRILPDTPEGFCRTPRKDSAYDPKGTVKEPKEGERAGAAGNPPSPDFSGGLPDLERQVCELFPHALPVLTDRERVALLGVQSLLALLTADDWLALRVWFVEADDAARRQKLWPRDRAEFLDRAGEAIEKARKWWDLRGRRWWAYRSGEVGAVEAYRAGDGLAWQDFQDFATETGKDPGEVGDAFRDGRWAREFVAWAMGSSEEGGNA